MAFLVMLERLNPVERAVFLLRESFDFSHREVADVIGRSEANCRQIERRARERLAGPVRARVTNPEVHERLTEGFLRAVRGGDVDGLLRLLAEDVVSYSDGGGKVSAARRPVIGADRVARFWLGLAAKAPPGVEFRIALVNGRAGILTHIDGQLYNVIALYPEDGRIRRIFVVVNPDKLGVSP
jgi:RNA polymerase sigma-70 factor (ECF subfamily)